MAKVTVQNVVVTEVAGNDQKVEFALQTLATTAVQGLIAYKAVTVTPSWRRLLPGLDDLDETILAEEIAETVTLELDPVYIGGQ